MSIIQDVELEHDAWLKIIDTISQMGSDYETTEVLLHILSNMPDDQNLLDAVIDVAKSNVGSEHEMKRFNKALKNASKS